MQTEINISEAISEFRKFSRAFKALEHAEKVLEALSHLPRLESEVNEKIEANKVLRDALVAEVQTLGSAVEKLGTTKQSLELDVKNLSLEKIAKAEEIVRNAQEKATSIISAAESTRDSIQVQVRELQKNKVEVAESLERVKAELKETTDYIAKAKQRFIKTFS
jgi:cell division septum initiation protein DivIVA